MAQRVAEHVVRGRLFGPKRLLRVDLHGVSAFGAGAEHVLIRWEWVEGIDIEKGAVLVRGSQDCIALPSGAFGLAPRELADELERARGIHNRSDVIGRLSMGAGGGGEEDDS